MKILFIPADNLTVNVSRSYYLANSLAKYSDLYFVTWHNHRSVIWEGKGISYFNTIKCFFKSLFRATKINEPIENELLDTLKNNRSKPRIPFGSLVELGIIKPGTNIFDNKKKITAKILADGSIKHNRAEGSIHKVAATILGAESCNGWTYWHCDINGSIYPIDYLRQRLISKN